MLSSSTRESFQSFLNICLLFLIEKSSATKFLPTSVLSLLFAPKHVGGQFCICYVSFSKIFDGCKIHEIPSSSCLTCQTVTPTVNSAVLAPSNINGGIHISSTSPSPSQPSCKKNSLAIFTYSSALS